MTMPSLRKGLILRDRLPYVFELLPDMRLRAAMKFATRSTPNASLQTSTASRPGSAPTHPGQVKVQHLCRPAHQNRATSLRPSSTPTGNFPVTKPDFWSSVPFWCAIFLCFFYRQKNSTPKPYQLFRYRCAIFCRIFVGKNSTPKPSLAAHPTGKFLVEELILHKNGPGHDRFGVRFFASFL